MIKKNKYKSLLFVLSLLMFSLISFNTSFINAESNKTIINFIDEDGKSLDIKDTVSIVKLEDQGGTKVPVSVYIKDGKETTDYNKGLPHHKRIVICLNNLVWPCGHDNYTISSIYNSTLLQVGILLLIN